MIGRVNTGGGGGTKSTIIVSIETGSTVAAYSDSSYQTLVKTAIEKSTGEYWLTGLANGPYYIKATNGTDVTTKSYTINEYGVYRITMAYTVVLSLVSLLSSTETISYTSTGGASGSVSVSDSSPATVVANPNDTYTFSSGSTLWTATVATGTADMTVNCYYGTPLYWYGKFISPLTNSWTDSTSAHTIKTTSISVYGKGSSDNIRYSALNARLNLSGYNTLRTIAYGATTTASYHRVGLASSTSSPKTNLIGTVSVASTTPTIYTLDISRTSSGYVAIGGTDPSASRATYVNALWLE